jgi:GGDEF domain-containing protein
MALQALPTSTDILTEQGAMISIQQNLSELERAHQLRTIALECYIDAIKNVAHYAVDLDATLTVPHRKYLSDLATELADVSPAVLSESRATVRGLLRDYRDRAAQYLGGLRSQLTSTAQALREIVEGLSQCDTEHTDKLRGALVKLRDVAGSPAGSEVRTALRAVADNIEQSLEQMRKQHQFTVAQMQGELRLMHNRIDSLEAAASTDEATKFSNRRFLAEYLGAAPAEGTCYLVLKMRGLGEARAKFGAAIADDVVSTFGRRLRNTIPKDSVVGRWSEQDFLAIVPAGVKAADGILIKRFAEHLSMPYACMIGGKVVRIPIVVMAESIGFPTGTTAEQIQASVADSFQ